MSDYISREAAKEFFLNMDAGSSRSYATMLTPEEFVEYFDEIPAADAEPVRYGQWEGYTHSRYCGIDEYGEPIFRDGIVYYCSNPKCRRKTVIKENYCPSCGAKMDLEGETNDD
nr:MAG TPA: zinc-ribbon containing domain protein [Caudoviricetes sp.]